MILISPSLHTVSHRFEVDSAQLTTPTASDRIVQRPFSTLMQNRWNKQVDVLFERAAEWNGHVTVWVRRVFYGGDAAPKDDTANK